MYDAWMPACFCSGRTLHALQHKIIILLNVIITIVRKMPFYSFWNKERVPTTIQLELLICIIIFFRLCLHEKCSWPILGPLIHSLTCRASSSVLSLWSSGMKLRVDMHCHVWTLLHIGTYGWSRRRWWGGTAPDFCGCGCGSGWRGRSRPGGGKVRSSNCCSLTN